MPERHEHEHEHQKEEPIKDAEGHEVLNPDPAQPMPTGEEVG